MIQRADALKWLCDVPATPDLILTDPPHLDNFENQWDHLNFTREWTRLAIAALPEHGTLYHTCGATPTELRNYLHSYQPHQILVWPHDPTPRPEGFGLFAPAHHFHLMLRAPEAPQPFRYGTTIVDLLKPRPLWTAIIEALTLPGAMVVDPFAGRGEIPAAARKSGRLWAGCEVLEEPANYCKSIGL